VSRQQLPAELNGAKRFPTVVVPKPFVFFLHKVVIECHIMRHKNLPGRDFYQLFGHFVELGCIGNHLVGDAGQPGNVVRNVALRVNQADERIGHLPAIVDVNSDFRNFPVSVTGSGGFYVDYGVHQLQR